jgi:ABC-type transport system substrate-binding protein
VDGFVVKNNDAFCILKYFHSNRTGEYTRIKDPLIDNLLAKAREEINPNIRDAIYRDINRRIMEEVYAIPIEQSQQIDIFGTNVHIANNSFGFKYLFNFANVWIE